MLFSKYMGCHEAIALQTTPLRNHDVHTLYRLNVLRSGNNKFLINSPLFLSSSHWTSLYCMIFSFWALKDRRQITMSRRLTNNMFPLNFPPNFATQKHLEVIYFRLFLSYSKNIIKIKGNGKQNIIKYTFCTRRNWPLIWRSVWPCVLLRE